MFVGLFLRINILAWLLVGLLLASSGCGAGKTPDCASQGVSLAKSFPGLEVKSISGGYKLFTKGPEFGCLGVVWEGQTNAPPSYRLQLEKTGAYKLQDPVTKQFVDTPLNATVAAGISKVDVLIYIIRNIKDINTYDCANIVKGKLTGGCWGQADCVFAMQIKDVPPGGGGGTCAICERETCNQKDDDCDGQVDEKDDNQSPCGEVMGQGCKGADKVPTSCSGSACGCLVVAGQTYICGGDSAATTKWVPLNTATGLCSKANDGKEYFCGTTKMLCDQCDGKYVFRSTEGGRCVNTLTFKK